jgi:hypothetical protein
MLGGFIVFLLIDRGRDSKDSVPKLLKKIDRRMQSLFPYQYRKDNSPNFRALDPATAELVWWIAQCAYPLAQIFGMLDRLEE